MKPSKLWAIMLFDRAAFPFMPLVFCYCVRLARNIHAIIAASTRVIHFLHKIKLSTSTPFKPPVDCALCTAQIFFE
jgi:hypothetical protein